jgi:hypothetical protein
MSDARLPMAYRDRCAHLLIPLNECRRETWFAPWKCKVETASARPKWFSDVSQDERHSYEKCQYDEFMKRVKKMEELKAAKKEETS